MPTVAAGRDLQLVLLAELGARAIGAGGFRAD